MQAHYLPWQSRNEFIKLCVKKVKTEIPTEIEKSYYYGLIVDGTPDDSHTEQFTFVIRYSVLKNGIWEVMERFLKVQDCEKKKVLLAGETAGVSSNKQLVYRCMAYQTQGGVQE
ncbi:Hypothetical predicted protein [Paramuricea clavata]|uniref:Uncharacterized protein n=1 Tax=Paramuricea clavata TaxID=317549 RepID=A0A6S7JP24_PARCT|nr:Hypothetical predicted protein [Paramuricea clavata]